MYRLQITSILHEAGVTEMEEILVKESALPEIEKYTGLKGMPIVFIKVCQYYLTVLTESSLLTGLSRR